MRKSRKPKKEVLENLIRAKSGNLTHVAKAIGVVRRTVEKWIQKDKALQEVVREARESLIDFTETQAYLMIQGIPDLKVNKYTGKEEQVGWIEKPDSNLIKFILSTIGRHRGYTQNIDVTTQGDKINSGVNIPFNLVIKVKDDEAEGAD